MNFNQNGIKRIAFYSIVVRHTEKSQRSVKHIWFLPTLKPNAEKPKELALFRPTTGQ
jgi:ribosomal protein S16